MNRDRLFPKQRFTWYLSRATLACTAFGLVLALALVLLVSSMGDGGGDRVGMATDSMRGLMPWILGWSVNGLVVGALWWLLGQAFGRPRR